MKTRIATFSALCVFAIAAISCSKEEKGIQPATFESFRLNAVSEATDKTHLDGTSVIWDNGDALSAFSADAATHTNNKLECTSYGTSRASFSGQIDAGTTSFYAVYPYNSSLSYSEGVISSASIPATQTATNGSFANGVSLAMASGTRTPGVPDCGDLNFKNLCAVLSFTLPEDIDFANRIVVTSKSGAGMAGAVSIDCASQTISGASASSVTLNGTFAGGGTYYVAVAPGTYADGFRFTITSDKGNSYTRETTKTVPAEAGKIYPLGTLSLALADADFTHSVTITHDYSNQVLDGSTARLNVEVNKSEFAYAVKEIRVENVKLVRNSVTYCTLGSHSAPAKFSVSLVNTSSTPYIPKGEYDYSADLYYKVTSSAGKTTERKMSISGKANSVSPDATKFTVDVNLNGYTSYSCYKGTDGQSASVNNANNFDNATIKGIGATYIEGTGISDAVYNQCKDLLSISSTLDGNAVSGDKGGQSWAAHTIGATWGFDGASGTCASTKTVYVTGLPYDAAPPKNTGNNPWEAMEGRISWKSDYVEMNYSAAKYPRIKSPSYYIPSNLDVKIYAKIVRNKTTLKQNHDLVISLSSDSHIYYKGGLASEETYESSFDATMESSLNVWRIQYEYMATGPLTYVYYFKIRYR